jgi:hypothetical protein
MMIAMINRQRNSTPMYLQLMGKFSACLSFHAHQNSLETQNHPCFLIF